MFVALSSRSSVPVCDHGHIPGRLSRPPAGGFTRTSELRAREELTAWKLNLLIFPSVIHHHPFHSTSSSLPFSSRAECMIMLRTAITNAPRSSGGLLRPTRSLGSLRATAAAQSQQQPMVPPVPSRNLVSSVLLSRDAYDRQNVNQLKGELKTRGLTTSGRRAELVIRLLNDDAQRSGSGLVLDNIPAKEPKLRRGKASLASLRGKDGGKTGTQASSATPTNKLANDPSSTSSSASNSSAPAAPSSPTPKTEASPPTSSGTPIVGEGATISHPPEIKPGDTVSPSLNVIDGKVQVPEKLPSASGPPGVPPQKEPDHPETFKINIPYEELAELPGPDIVSRQRPCPCGDLISY